MQTFKSGDLCIKRSSRDGERWTIEGPSGTVFEFGSHQMAKAFCAWHMKLSCAECSNEGCDKEEKAA